MVQAHAYELLNQKDEGRGSHPLYAASERLAAALDRLERSLKHARPAAEPRHGEQLGFFERENEELKGERKKLNAALADLEHQYDDLHGVASAVYGKLDDSIKRLTRLIEN